jgi:ABC-2 type transport system permease protein
MLLSTIGLPRKVRNLGPDSPEAQSVLIKPFSMAPAPIMLATFIVGIFYSLDALYGERRDRSLLFWKSLPVSDRTAVLAKISIPLIVLPLIAFALSIVVLTFLMIASTDVLLLNGVNPARLWLAVGFIQEPIVMFYGLTVHALWFAPLYAWLLLISAWARRMPILWAVLPPFMIMFFERMFTRTNYFATFLGYRVTGAMKRAFASGHTNGNVHWVSDLDPGKFLITPGLWIGLLFAALFLAAAIRLRRNREPI